MLSNFNITDHYNQDKRLIIYSCIDMNKFPLYYCIREYQQYRTNNFKIKIKKIEDSSISDDHSLILEDR